MKYIQFNKRKNDLKIKNVLTLTKMPRKPMSFLQKWLDYLRLEIESQRNKNNYLIIGSAEKLLKFKGQLNFVLK